MVRSPMGDLAGLDICWRSRKDRGLKVGNRGCAVRAGRFGQKTGQGLLQIRRRLAFAAARSGGRKADRRNACSGSAASPAWSATTRSIERMMYPNDQRGRAHPRRGIAARPSDIDVIWLYGYGWPIYRAARFLRRPGRSQALADGCLMYAKETTIPRWSRAPLPSVSPPKARPLRHWRSRKRLDGDEAQSLHSLPPLRGSG